MNKYLKGCLLILGILILAASTVAGFFYYQMSTSRERSEADHLECASIQYIMNNTKIEISDSLMAKDSGNIKLYLTKDSVKIDSAEISNQHKDRIEFTLPFEKAPISSTILIKTAGHEFLIENMKYFNNEKWGMFGYLGKDCQFSYDYKKLK